MSAKSAKERMDALANKNAENQKVEELKKELSIDVLILKELQKQNVKVEQMRQNLNNLTWWYLYIGLIVFAIVIFLMLTGIGVGLLNA